MAMIREYCRPGSPAEAYELLSGRPDAAVIAGGAFIRLSSREIGLGIDLCAAGLDTITQSDAAVEIGAMTTLGQLEGSGILQKNFDGLIPATVRHITGVQMRNLITTGGTVYGRYGFSELIACLLVLDCAILLHKGGETGLDDFLRQRGGTKDILEKVIIRKENIRACYKMARSTWGSLPMLSVAASRGPNGHKIAVGARPGLARLAANAMASLKTGPADEEACRKAGELAADEMDFSDDRRASGAYRKELCRVLVHRALMEVQP